MSRSLGKSKVAFWLVFAAVCGAAQNASLTGPTPVAQQPTSAPLQYVRAGKLLDVRSGKLLDDQVIAIRGGRIERVAPASKEAIPAGAKAVDLSRATVLPGLID